MSRRRARVDGRRRAPRPVRRGAPRPLLVVAGVLVLVALVPVTYVPDFLGIGASKVVVGYGPSNIVCLWLAAVLGIIAYNVRKMRGRRPDPGVVAWAQENGWQAGGVSAETLVALQRGAPFTTSDRPFATEIVSCRRDGRRAVSWTQRWVVGAGADTTEWRAHVVALELPVALPRLEVTPERLVDRALSSLGRQDVSVELEAFNRAFRVAADDERVAHAVLHPRLVERLLQADARDVRWRIDGAWIAAWTSGHTSVQRIEPWTRLLLDVVDSLPRHLLEDHARSPNA